MKKQPALWMLKCRLLFPIRRLTAEPQAYAYRLAKHPFQTDAGSLHFRLRFHHVRIHQQPFLPLKDTHAHLAGGRRVFHQPDPDTFLAA
jgi:hypothetical protein